MQALTLAMARTEASLIRAKVGIASTILEIAEIGLADSKYSATRHAALSLVQEVVVLLGLSLSSKIGSDLKELILIMSKLDEDPAVKSRARKLAHSLRPRE